MHEADLYTCTQCGSGFNEPKRIRVCQSCGGVKTIKLTSALTEIARVSAQQKEALESFDLQGFSAANTDFVDACKKLQPPSIH